MTFFDASTSLSQNFQFIFVVPLLKTTLVRVEASFVGLFFNQKVEAFAKVQLFVSNSLFISVLILY